MVHGLYGNGPPPQHALRETTPPCAPSGAHDLLRRLPMQWQKPSATDWRFGFEITMYVSAR